MKRLSNTETELKKSVAYKKRVFLIWCFTFSPVPMVTPGRIIMLIDINFTPLNIIFFFCWVVCFSRHLIKFEFCLILLLDAITFWSLLGFYFWICVKSSCHLIFIYSMYKLHRSSYPEVFLGKGLLKICSKSTGEHLCRSATSIKLLTLLKSHFGMGVLL